jgi:hypothetical protein
MPVITVVASTYMAAVGERIAWFAIPGSAPGGMTAQRGWEWSAWMFVVGALVAGAIGGVRLARGVRSMSNACRQVRPGPDGVAWCPSASGPLLVGYRQPVIVMPTWARNLPPEVKSAMVGHEEAHRRRRDNWRLLAEHSAMALMPWCKPLVHLHAALLAAREELCDAAALRGADLSTRRGYAHALIVALRQPGGSAPVASTMAGRLEAMQQRLDGILGTTARSGAGDTLAYAAMLWIVMGLCGVATAWMASASLETLAGTHGMAMRFEAVEGNPSVYRVSTLGSSPGTRGVFRPGVYEAHFSQRRDGEWVISAATAAPR